MRRDTGTLAVVPFVATPSPQPSPAAPPAAATPREQSAGDASTRSTPRDALLDNAKFVAIALVVVGHAIEPLIDIPEVRAVYAAIYSFHMPVFILIAGYLSRGYAGSPRQARRIVTGIVVPYVVFEVGYEIFNHFAAGGSASVDVLDPSYAMWFLAALFVWRLTAPLWKAVRPAYAVTLAAVVSLTSATLPMAEILDLKRILGFLPFFVLGLVIPDRYFTFVKTRAARLAAVPTLLAAVLGAYLVFPDTQTNWLYYTFNYAQMGVGPYTGMLGRGLVLLGSFVTLTAFLAVLPRRRVWFTALGAGTLYVYLIHRFVVKSAEYSGVYSTEWVHSVLGAGVAVALALLLALALSSAPVRTLFRPVVEPRLEWLFGKWSTKYKDGSQA